ncbi:Lrp/AsnC family transcriptional regulator [Amycolatopsis jejuensis]|uniref:Lrp/AsnC family transcriptional regulator n=1 Tax=Amycolatopsis jejuensis TaxID=330084 RepID=UPI0005278D01|nr:Lrp/AsnC family transcriptional regulator [Amycolatopsis jejuensis]
MDKTDHAIVRLLMANGRLPNNELADRVGLSPSPCLRRVRALEAAGVITGYHAAVDPAALGRGFGVLLHVEMADQRSEVIEAFEEASRNLDEIVSCRRMFGTPDYLMQVAVSDIAAYEQLYMTELTRMPGAARTNSQFAMKTVKTTPGHQW